MPRQPRVAAICVNWNGREVLPGTLDALLKSDYPPLEVLVVDNGSRDESASDLPEGVRLLSLNENRGYAAALNAGVRWLTREESGEGDADYYFFLNNDVELAPDLVGKLVAFAEEKGPGIFGPKILTYEEPGRLDMAWGEVTWHHVLARYHGKGAPDGRRWNEVRQVQLLQGSALLVHRSVPRQIGSLDENFFMYHEEVDYLYRASLHGFPVYYCPFTEARHRGAHSTRETPLRKVEWLRRNTVYFLRKHRAGGHRWACFYLTLSGSLAYNLLRLRTARTRAIWRGVREGFAVPLNRQPESRE
jgi:GT2 family glycosyltransferase